VKLTDLRKNVRVQTETTEGELPNATIDWYLQQAFDRQIAHENDWPFLEKVWTLTLAIDATTIALPADVNPPGIRALTDTSTGTALTMIDYSQAEQWYGGIDPASTFPAYYSVWGTTLYLWPPMKFAAERKFRMRGHRKPVNWIAQGPEAEPDCDERLHGPMIHYAIALAYAQQEDEVLEQVYMQRWQLDFTAAARAIMEPTHERPLVMAPRHITPIGHSSGMPRYTINVPGGS
jgi:hypothetical protein